MLNPTLDASIKADYAGLISLFTRRLGDRALAEDLVNQAFAESLTKLARRQIADPGRFSAFVYGVAFNLLRNYRRRTENRADRRIGNFTLDLLSTGLTPCDELCVSDLGKVVRDAVASMPVARDREVVRRFYLDEHPKDQICNDLGLSALHFDKIVFRARQRLRRLIEARGIDHGDATGSGIDLSICEHRDAVTSLPAELS